MEGGGTASQAVGLDFGAVLALGAAMGCDLAMLADVLPAVEMALLSTDSVGDEE